MIMMDSLGLKEIRVLRVFLVPQVYPDPLEREDHEVLLVLMGTPVWLVYLALREQKEIQDCPRVRHLQEIRVKEDVQVHRVLKVNKV